MMSLPSAFASAVWRCVWCCLVEGGVECGGGLAVLGSARCQASRVVGVGWERVRPASLLSSLAIPMRTFGQRYLLSCVYYTRADHLRGARNRIRGESQSQEEKAV